MSLKEKTNTKEDEDGNEKSEEQKIQPKSFSARATDKSRLSKDNAFRWSFLRQESLPREGMEAVVVSRPFMKEDEYSGEEELASYLPVLLNGNKHQRYLIRLSDYRLSTLADVLGSNLDSYSGKKIKLEKKETDNGPGLKFADDLGTADEEILEFIRQKVKIDDPDHEDWSEISGDE